MEKQVPGFGGYFLDQSGDVHVWLTQGSDAESARSAVGTRLRDERVATGRRNEPRIVVERGAFAFSQLAEWRSIIFDEVQAGRLPQVRGLDADEAANRVLVEHTGGATVVRMAIAALGVNPDALTLRPAVGVSNASRSLLRTVPYDIDAYANPVIGGVSIAWFGASGQSGACTLGFTATVNGVNRFITAAHCSDVQYGTDGATIRQGPFANSPVLGSEISDPAGGNCPSPPWFGAICRASDAALFSFAAGAPPVQIGLIARTQFRSGPGKNAAYGSKVFDHANPYFVIDALDNNSWVPGTPVDKIGYTSGWTYGPVLNTCFDYFGDIRWPVGRGVSCAYLIDARVEGGDSGGPIFYQHAEGNNRVTLGGISAARRDDGTLIASKFARIQMDLGVTLNAARPVTLATPSLGGALAGVQPTLSWPAVSGATFYRVTRAWYNYQTGQGSNGDETFTVFTNTFADPNLSAASYTGGTMPNFSTPGYIRYQIRAFTLSANMSETPIHPEFSVRG